MFPTQAIKSRSIWSGTKPAFTPIIVAIAMLFSVVQSSWAEDQIVTIYFAGTGSDVWWNLPAETSWGNHEEILATLYWEQQGLLSHHMWFVDGIGSGCSHLGILGDLGDLIGSGFPGWDICRGWQTNLDEATDILEAIMFDYPDDEIILNLVG